MKVNDERYADAFAAEADGLAALRAAGLRAPQPIRYGVAGNEAYLLLEHLELKGKGDFAALGRMLAAAHRKPGPRFGWARDNYIGSTPQSNGWRDDWSEFWRERRLRPQLELAARNGFDLVRSIRRRSSGTTSRNRRCCTATCGAATLDSRAKGRWYSTRRCTTATARPTSR